LQSGDQLGLLHLGVERDLSLLQLRLQLCCPSEVRAGMPSVTPIGNGAVSSAHQIDHAERKAKRRSTFILEIS
jgi:hypothetical protein